MIPDPISPDLRTFELRNNRPACVGILKPHAENSDLPAVFQSVPDVQRFTLHADASFAVLVPVDIHRITEQPELSVQPNYLYNKPVAPSIAGP